MYKKELLSDEEKLIHYCWFGRNKKPYLVKCCIKSWRKLKGFKVIEWNEDNFDINCNEFVKTAYDMGMYAFVSDYVRLKVLFDFGGLYFDTDLYVLKNFYPLVELYA